MPGMSSFCGLGLSSRRAVGGSAPSFSFDDLPGLVAWYDAADATTIVEGATTDSVGEWLDKSSAGADMQQTTGASQPEVVSGAQNGLPGVRTIVDNEFVEMPSGEVVGRTFFIVARWADTLGNFRPVLGHRSLSEWHGGFASSGELFFASGASSDLVNGSGWINGVPTNPTDMVRYTTATIHVFEALADVRFSNIARDRLTVDRTFKGDMFEIAALSGVLTTAQKNDAGQYLGSKWGISWSDIT